MVTRWVLVVGSGVALAVAASAAALLHGTGPTRVSVPARGGAIEAQEEDQVTADRLAALAQAQARGTFGGPAATTTRAASGWSARGS